MIVLDRDLPKIHGDDVCRALVARGSRSRVLMLTAADTIERPRRRPRSRRRRLPAEAVRVRRARRPHPRARAARPARPLPPLLARGDSASTPCSGVATRAGRRLELEPEGARGARAAARRRRRAGLDPRAARPRLGRVRRPRRSTWSRSRSAGCDASSVSPPRSRRSPHAGYRISPNCTAARAHDPPSPHLALRRSLPLLGQPRLLTITYVLVEHQYTGNFFIRSGRSSVSTVAGNDRPRQLSSNGKATVPRDLCPRTWPSRTSRFCRPRRMAQSDAALHQLFDRLGDRARA